MASGELVYRSDRKLAHLALQLGVDTTWFRTALTLTGSARVAVPVAPGTSARARGDLTAERVVADDEDRQRARLLADVIAALERDRPLPHLDDPRADWPRGGWFRFRRHLRIGAGVADLDHSVNAIVFVDAAPVDPYDGLKAGLLMTGAPVHLVPPYSFDVPEAILGSRSGSGTNELFTWLRDRNEAIPPDARTGFSGPAAELFAANPVADAPSTAYSMYHLFAGDDWMDPLFPGVRRPVMVEGVAAASLVTPIDQATVVLGSPLHVRICDDRAVDALDEDPVSHAPHSEAPRRRRRLLGRAR